MRILGVDPGSNATGYGVVERRDGRLHHVAHGVIRPPSGVELSVRLAHIYAAVGQVVASARPDLAAVERVFVAASPRSALVLGQARGAVLASLGAAGLEVAELSAREVKQAVVGTGGARKAQVQTMVTRLLCLEQEPASDAADALAIALCQAQIGRLAGLGATSSRRRRAGLRSAAHLQDRVR